VLPRSSFRLMDGATMPDCPLRDSEDKFGEAHYFLHRMETEYHTPTKFRYCINAYLAALKVVVSRVRIDMERAGESQWLKANKEAFIQGDEVLGRFFKGRDIVLHQRDIARGSAVQYGLFRFNKMKLVHEIDIPHDTPSATILDRAKFIYIDHLLDEEHSEIGMQIGVKRTYRFKELSDTDDAYTASCRALARMSRLLGAAHNHLGLKFDVVDDAELDRLNPVERFNLFQETDVDPDLVYQWEWLERDS
jgi:hypothetical protein